MLPTLEDHCVALVAIQIACSLEHNSACLSIQLHLVLMFAQVSPSPTQVESLGVANSTPPTHLLNPHVTFINKMLRGDLDGLRYPCKLVARPGSGAQL